MKNNISCVKNCTGCQACRLICPQKAIKMVQNEEGFLYPQIDTEKCTGCGLCYNRCPVINAEYSNNLNPDCYIIAASDALRKESSSGAFFPILAEYVLNQGGTVYGVVLDDDKKTYHCAVLKKENLSILKGSKYLQSDVKNTYQSVKDDLKNGKYVLYTGTPCQIAGLKKYLGKNDDKLITVDLVCHGVPSPLVWSMYLNEFEKETGEKVFEVNFRDKINGWENQTFSLKTNKKIHYFDGLKNDFMKSFLYNICLRKSCGNCPFNKVPRQGDLTMGDFWGFRQYNKKINDQKGLSVLLVNTEKGKNILNCIKNSFHIFMKISFKDAIAGNPNIIGFSKHHKNRESFFRDIKTKTIKESVENAMNEKYDCLIMNFWFAHNYGAILTCFALQETLKSFGLNVGIIDFKGGPAQGIPFEQCISADFSKKYFNLTPPCNNDIDLQALNYKTNTFIVGSDQVWRYSLTGASVHTYELDFVSPENKRIAYAASFGHDTYTENPDIFKSKYFFNLFDHISVREKTGSDILKNTFNLPSQVTLDPVFLPDKSLWSTIVDTSNLSGNDFILSYFLAYNEHSKNLEKNVSKYYKETEFRTMSLAKNAKALPVEDWLYNIKNCKILLTDSFHGVCFAIIFGKPFICLRNLNRANTRFDTIIHLLKNDNNFFMEGNEKQINLENISKIHNTVDFDEARKASIDWLLNAIQAPKQECSIETQMLHYLVLNKPVNKFDIYIPYLRPILKLQKIKYQILASVTFGKKSRKYKQKRATIKQMLRQLP